MAGALKSLKTSKFLQNISNIPTKYLVIFVGSNVNMERSKTAMRFVLIYMVFATFLAHGQQNAVEYSIKGAVTDEHQSPIPFANAAVYLDRDSSLVNGAVSDETGVFSVRLRPGNYHLKITFLSFEAKTIAGIIVVNQNIDLGKIVLKSGTRLLKEVEIQGEKSQMELQLDKRVFNVGKDLSNTGTNAADILDNIPSVSVDVDGRVSLRGSENVRILINGKPSGLTSRDPDALRHLQGNLVERIEVITNPSSRYDAAGEVGIINIVLKKNQAAGLNGTFSASAGYPDFYGASYSINLRRKKINFLSSYGMDYRKSPTFSRSLQRFGLNDSSYTQYTDRTTSELSHNFSAGADYFLNDQNSITGAIMYNIADGQNRAMLTYNDFKADLLTGTTVRTDREIEDEENIEASLRYKKDFKQKGHSLTADFQYIKSVDAEESDYTQVSSNTTILQHARNTAVEKNWQVQADYIKPIYKEGKFEAGLKSATRIVDNDYMLEQQNGEGDWTEFPAFNNNMIYTERIHAAYAMAGNKFNKFSIQGGLRLEYSDITTELTETNEVNHREYLNLFPSINLGYHLSKNKTVQISYSYRISRPEFRDLLPFSDFTDTRSFFIGNPNVNPEYTHSFEAGYLLEWENGSVLPSAYYRYRQGVIQRITEVDNEGIIRIFPINMATEDAYGLEVNFSRNIHKWWQINSSFNFYRAITDGVYKEQQLHSDTYSFTNRTTSKMSFFKAVDFQASLIYRAPRITTQGKQLSVYSLDLGLSRDIFKGKGTLTANVRDLMNTRVRRSVVDIEDYYSESRAQRRARQFMLTLTYRLNKKKERERRSNGDGGDDHDGDF